MIFEKYRNYIFIALLLLLYFILDYHNILFLRPQGIHFIRQTDGLSFVANYYKNGFHFFEPQMFNLQSTDGKAACEFPMLYYLTALLYVVFGEHEFILRLITLSIVSIGFCYLFKLLCLLLQDFVYALTFTFLFISSTILLYYTNNFIPDASAFGFTLIGWYFFFAGLKNKEKKKYFLLCFVFFLLASLLKVTYFINPLSAILSLFVIDLYSGSSTKNLFKKNTLPLSAFILSFLLTLSWNSYMLHYNSVNHDTYFFTHVLPIWSMDNNEIAIVWDHICNYWYSNYYYQSTLHVFLVLVIAGFLLIKKSDKQILIPSFILLLGSLCYFLLFFGPFKYHDYYFIALIPAIILVITNAFVAAKNKFPKWINHSVSKTLLILLCCLSLYYAKKRVHQRYDDTKDLYASIGFKFADTREYLDSLSISENAKIIIVTDNSTNGGLYFINRSGWSVGDTSEASKINIKKYISQGADYILFTDKKYVDLGLGGVKVGEKKGVLIYKL